MSNSFDDAFIGSGVTTANLTTAITNAKAAGAKTIILPPGTHYVGKVPNPTGIVFLGGDLVEQTSTLSSSFNIINSYADQLTYDCGKEYLYALHNEISMQGSVKIKLYGDSTVFGVGVPADYKPQKILVDQALARGVAGMSVTNLAVSGTTAYQWDTSSIVSDLSTKCIIVSYGINDPAVGTAEDFYNNMAARLKTVRDARNVQSLTIIIKGSNSTSDWPNGRSQLWHEQIAPVYRRLAREFQCYFLDIYALYRDSRNSAYLWMDTLKYVQQDGVEVDTNIHPNAFGNMWIWGKLAEYIFPSCLSQRATNGYRNICAAHMQLSIYAAPADFPLGRSIYRAELAGWPSSGIVVVEKSVDGVVTQELTADNRSVIKVHRRHSISSAPGTWTEFTGIGRNLVLQNGWLNFDPSYMPPQLVVEESGYISGRGSIKPGTLSAGTTILNVFSAVANCGPLLNESISLECNTGSILCVLTPLGNLVIKSVSGSPTEVMLSRLRWMPS